MPLRQTPPSSRFHACPVFVALVAAHDPPRRWRTIRARKRKNHPPRQKGATAPTSSPPAKQAEKPADKTDELRKPPKKPAEKKPADKKAEDKKPADKKADDKEGSGEESG